MKPKELEPHEKALQDAYEEREQSAATVGQPHSPPCPDCGHHLLIVMKRKMKGH